MGAETWEFVQSIFLILGGLGLFIYGMNIMSDGLSSIAGDRMHSVLEKATSNRFFGITLGAVVTMIIQSSSATTVMVVGFVNASLMTLQQAIGVIMGANIGTTITAQIIAFKIDPIAPLLIFIGLALKLIPKRRGLKNLGTILLGFGILFFGISVMGAPLKEFSRTDGFQNFLIAFNQPLLSIMAGMIFTAIIQSSSATTGIIVAMYLSGVDIPLQESAFIILGSNIGTCITAVLASLTGNRESKRAALTHVLFNTIGVVIFGTLISIFPGFLVWIQSTWHEKARQVAMFHTIFNCFTVVLLVGFVKQLALVVQKIIPEEADENLYTKRLLYLGPNVLKSPPLALSQAQKEMGRMGKVSLENLKDAMEAFFERDDEKAKKVLETEVIVNYLNHQITAWVVRIWSLELSPADVEKLGIMIRTIYDIERISDHAENIAEYTMDEVQSEHSFSASAMKDLKRLSEATMETVKRALEVFENDYVAQVSEVERLEDRVDQLTEELIADHIQRLKEKKCEPSSGVAYTDIIMNLERCGDHAANIANSILGEVSI
jgi:phosphate:Na+ symporter